MSTSAYLAARRDRVAAAWEFDDGIVLVGAGGPVSLPGYGDRVYPFRAHAEYFYLTDHERPGSVLAYDPREGWTEFVPEVTEEERVWMGGGVNVGTPLSALGAWLEARKGGPPAMLGCPLRHVEADGERTGRLREALRHARRPKDAIELQRMRRAAIATESGFKALRDGIRPGATERGIQIELEAEFFRAGGSGTAYDTIVASGSNTAVLHFLPTARVIGAGDLVLVDAGAECEGYACDVTRTYPAGDRFRPEQGEIYAVVLEAQENAIARCRAGVEYRDIHMEAAADLARGLKEFGILRGEVDSLVEGGAIALFFPHGIGHMVGLGVRDASGYLPGRERSDKPGLRFLRVDLPLEPGYAVTIEPGIYFIPALLNDAGRRERYRDEVDWERVGRMADFGGIRIEDDVLVTGGDPEVLTAAIPKDLG